MNIEDLAAEQFTVDMLKQPGARGRAHAAATFANNASARAALDAANRDDQAAAAASIQVSPRAGSQRARAYIKERFGRSFDGGDAA